MPKPRPPRSVRAVYGFGQQVLEEVRAKGGKYAPGVIQRIMKKENLPEWRVRKAMQFASKYSIEDLEYLENLKRRYGRPLDISIIYAVMHVPDKEGRQQLERDAAENNWTFREVLKERKLRFPDDEKARKGGRRPPAAETRKSALQQLAESSDRWLHMAHQLAPQDDAKRRKKGPKALLLPDSVKERLTEATVAVERLVAAVRKATSAKPARRRRTARRR